MKYHGGADLKTITQENLAALEKGVTNLERHVENVQKNYGIPCVVSINRFDHDTQAELDLLGSRITSSAPGSCSPSLGRRRQGRGGTGAHVVDLCESKGNFQFVYETRTRSRDRSSRDLVILVQSVSLSSYTNWKLPLLSHRSTTMRASSAAPLPPSPQ